MWSVWRLNVGKKHEASFDQYSLAQKMWLLFKKAFMIPQTWTFKVRSCDRQMTFISLR